MFGFGKTKSLPDIKTDEQILESLDFAIVCSMAIMRTTGKPCEEPAFVMAIVKCEKCGGTLNVPYCIEHLNDLLNNRTGHSTECYGKLFHVSHVSIK